MAIELKAESREVFGSKVKRLRADGVVPAEIYGREIDNISIQVSEKEARRVLKEAGNTNLIEIKVGRKKVIPTLARNVQFSTLKQRLLHIDFYAVVMTDTVTVEVPIVIIGQTDLVDVELGTLVTGINSLDIEALPGSIPETIEVDISILKDFSDSIHVGDIIAPEGATIQSNADSLLATIQPPRLEEELDELDEEIIEGAEMAEPEVITARGDDDEEGDDE